MRLRVLRRALPLVLLLIIVGVGLAFVEGRWQQSAKMREEESAAGCASAPVALLVFAPTRAPDAADKLSLNLPGPVMVAPTPCPTECP